MLYEEDPTKPYWYRSKYIDKKKYELDITDEETFLENKANYNVGKLDMNTYICDINLVDYKNIDPEKAKNINNFTPQEITNDCGENILEIMKSMTTDSPNEVNKIVKRIGESNASIFDRSIVTIFNEMLPSRNEYYVVAIACDVKGRKLKRGKPPRFSIGAKYYSIRFSVGYSKDIWKVLEPKKLLTIPKNRIEYSELYDCLGDYGRFYFTYEYRISEDPDYLLNLNNQFIPCFYSSWRHLTIYPIITNICDCCFYNYSFKFFHKNGQIYYEDLKRDTNDCSGNSWGRLFYESGNIYSIENFIYFKTFGTKYFHEAYDNYVIPRRISFRDNKTIFSVELPIELAFIIDFKSLKREIRGVHNTEHFMGMMAYICLFLDEENNIIEYGFSKKENDCNSDLYKPEFYLVNNTPLGYNQKKYYSIFIDRIIPEEPYFDVKDMPDKNELKLIRDYLMYDVDYEYIDKLFN